MATTVGSYYVVTFLFKDVNDQYTRTSLNIDHDSLAADVSEMKTFCDSIATEMQAISGASLLGYNLTLNVVEGSPSAATEQGEDKALFSFGDDKVPVNYTLVNVPGCPDSILMANGIDIDLTNEDVDDFVSILIAPDVSGAEVVSAAGGGLVGVEAAYLSQRRSLTRRAKRAG